MNNPIPHQFWNPEFRFIRIKEKSKEPFGESWTKPSNQFKFDDVILHNWIKNGGNVGVIAGPGRLRVVDCDN